MGITYYQCHLFFRFPTSSHKHLSHRENSNLPTEIKNEKHIVIGSVNALKRNPLRCSAFEEQFKVQLIFLNYKEETAFGACLNAFIDSGNDLSINDL